VRRPLPLAARGRRLLLENHAFLGAAGLIVALAAGWYEGAPGPWAIASLGLLLVLLALRVVARIRLLESPAEAPATRLEDLRLGVLIVVGLHVLFRLTGGAASPLFPAMLLFIACTAVLTAKLAAGLLIGLALLLELLPLALGDPPAQVLPWLACHWLFGGLFAASYWLLLRGQLAASRRRHQQVMDSDRQRMTEEARAFRLLLPQLNAQGEQGASTARDALQLQEGVQGMRRAAHLQLAVLRDAFGLHSCVLYWRDAEGGRLRLLDAVSGSDRLSDREVAVGEGIAGNVALTGDPTRLHGLKVSNLGALQHYRDGERIAALVAVPVREVGEVRGVLLGDRRHDLAFTAANQAVFEQAAALLASSLQNERAFLAVERQRQDQALFHRALKSLNGSQEAAAVHQAILAAVTDVAAFDLAALTLFETASGKHRVVGITGLPALTANLQGKVFDGRGLVAQVVRTRHHLPVGAVVGDRPPVVFTEDAPLAGIRSLLVLPIPYGKEEVLGTLVLASQRPDLYDEEVRERLEVIAHAAAASLKGAERFELIRRMATTDGLTGLTNHRHFQARYEEILARARRTHGSFGLLLMDIDHFKQVNDTHGHPAGDEVLRTVARRLSATVREVDLVARYGGEEFVVLLEGATPEGARIMAERLREAIAAEDIPTAEQPLRITLSIGVACYPVHGDERELLLARADQALYAAKHGGRNRVQLHSEEVVPAALC